MDLNAKETITIFLSLVWGILIALSGAFFYMNNYNYNGLEKYTLYYKDISTQLRYLIFYLIFLTMSFVFLSYLYPIKEVFQNAFFYTEWTIRLYKSLLYVCIIYPSFLSIVIGIWCYWLELKKNI